MTTATTRREWRVQAEAEGQVAPAVRRGRSLGVVSEVLLWIAAAAGVICVVLVILAYTANITLIMFKTGSMAPTIPAGSVAIVQEIPAAQIAVGDVVTVDRPDQLPVTHRVTSIQPGATEASRIITMRGDANDSDDPFPYEVETVRVVHFSIAGLAPVIVQLGNPFVLGGITLAAALLVGWAFWPCERENKRVDAEAAP